MKHSDLIILSEVAILLDLQEKNLKILIKSKNACVPFVKSDVNYYLPKEEVQRMMENKKQNISLLIRVPTGYSTPKFIHEKYKFSMNIIRKLIDSNSVATFKTRGSVLINEEETKEYFDKLDRTKILIDEMLDSNEWITVGKIRRGIREEIVDLINEGQVNSSQVNILYYGKLKYILANRDFVNDLEQGKIKTCKEKNMLRNGIKQETNIRVKNIYNIKEVNDSIKMLINEEIVMRGKATYSIEEIAEIIGIKHDDIIAKINEGVLDNYFTIKTDGTYRTFVFFESGVRKILRLNGYISAQEISVILHIHQTAIIRIINRIVEKKVNFLQQTFIKYDFSEKVIVEYLKIHASRKDDLKEILELRLNFIDTPYKKTLVLAVKYLEREISILGEKSMALEKKFDFGRSMNSMEKLLIDIQKEIFLYDNEEIQQILINKNFKISHTKKITKFMNFVREELGTECKYTKEIGPTLVQQLRNSDSSKDSKIYTQEEWCGYYEFLKDIDIHIANAFKDARYAQIWLYCILHLIVTWRTKDIILKIPNIPLEILGVFNFKWFELGNEFTLSMAMMVFEQVKFSLDGIIAYKNKMNLHLNIPVSLKIPIAVILVINEIHRRNNNKEFIFYRLKSSMPTKRNDFTKFFGNKPDLVNFENTKANSTLMTYNYATAANVVGMAGVAYELNRYSRSHKEKFGQITNTTAIYLHLDNIDGSPLNTAYQIMERGSFGFMYIKLLNACFRNGEFDVLKQNEMTDVVKDMRCRISPLALENMCDQILGQRATVDLGVEILSVKENSRNAPPETLKIITSRLEGKIVKRYKEIAVNMFPEESEKLNVFIEEKCSVINKIFDKKIKGEEVCLKILKDIRNGERNCVTSYSNCIFDELEQVKKCPYKNPETCVGCNYNLMTISLLYEVVARLNKILDEMIQNKSLSELDLIRDTSLMHTYLSIIIQAKMQYESVDDNILSAFYNEKDIKQKLNKLRSDNKILYINKIIMKE